MQGVVAKFMLVKVVKLPRYTMLPFSLSSLASERSAARFTTWPHVVAPYFGMWQSHWASLASFGTAGDAAPFSQNHDASTWPHPVKLSNYVLKGQR